MHGSIHASCIEVCLSCISELVHEPCILYYYDLFVRHCDTLPGGHKFDFRQGNPNRLYLAICDPNRREAPAKTALLPVTKIEISFRQALCYP